MDYRYIGCTENREVVKGTIAAASPEVAAKILTSQGYQIFSLKAVPAFMPSQEQMFPSFSKITPQVIIVFSRQLALLLESGTDIVTSLELLKAQTTKKNFKKIIEGIISDLRGGSRLSAALARHSRVFSKVYVESVRVGERAGGLETVLRQIADYMEKDARATKQIKGALRYPAIVTVVAFIVIGILVTFVLPAFTDLYSSLGAELPTITTMTLSVFRWLSHYGPYLVGALLLIAGLGYLYTKTQDGRLLRDRLLLKLPLVGRVIHLSELLHCCRTMSILYQAGLPVTEIISSVIDNSNNMVIKNALTQVQEDVLRGEGISRSMDRSEYFLPMMVQMVGVGEATGNLDVTLQATADNYETEAEDRVYSLIGLIQPAITLVIGIMVAIIALSLVAAMYSAYGQIL